MPSVQTCTLDRSVSASVDKLGLGTYKLRYIVTTDGAMGPKALALGALSASPHALPAFWATYNYLSEQDYLSFAQEYEIERDPDSLTLYYITVNYKPAERGEISGNDGNTSTVGEPINAIATPSARTPVLWWDRETYTRKVEKAFDGEAIVNSCYSPYEDCHEEEETRGVLVVEFNVTTIAAMIQLSSIYERATNSTSWNKFGQTYPARTVVCRQVSSLQPFTESVSTAYYRVSMRFAFADYDQSKGWDTWDATYIQNGSCYWKKSESGVYVDDADGFHKRFPLPNGEPVLLKADGTRLPDGETPVTKRFRVKREVDFNSLPF